MTIPSPLITPRLLLRPWTATDLAMLARLAADAQVVRWVADGAPWSPERAAQSHERVLAHWAAHGFGWRVLQPRDQSPAIGLLALNFAPEGTPGVRPEEFEIGWWLDPAAWGHGYGAEAAAAVRDDAFSRLRAPHIIARIRPPNRASRRLAEAIGMAVAFETVDSSGIPVVIYRIDAPGAKLDAVADG